MAEWSIAAVLKTVVLRGTGGSNPSLSAKEFVNQVFANSFFMSIPYPYQRKSPFQAKQNPQNNIIFVPQILNR